LQNNQVIMKSILFSGLISCSFLLGAARTNGQTFWQFDQPVMASSPNGPRFYAYPENNIVILRWTAGNERSVDRYVIERSTDSIHFDPLHEIVGRGAIDGPGDSSYQDADSYPLTSPYFYRLKTLFTDGGSIYSPIIRMDMDPKRIPVLKPTVLQRGGTLRMDNLQQQQPLVVNFFSASGGLIASYLVNGTTFDINTSNLGKGILFYRISDSRNALLCAGKILIQ
jgi:hypothetical protein